MLPGPFNSAESKTAFAQLQLELATLPSAAMSNPRGITLNELFVGYLEHAERHYRGPDGKLTGEFALIKNVCRHARDLYGLTAATDFGPLALRAVREKFIGLGWCRKTVNQQIERLRRMFKWAASVELIHFETFQRLTTVAGLQKGRTTARETMPVGPVEDSVVDALLPYLNRHVRGLVELQRLTGCRPGEVCRIRRSEIDMAGAVWLYRPSHHKNAHRGKTRTIALGPKAQKLLKEYFTPNLEDYLFSPRQAVEELRADRAANRKTPRYPSHIKRNAAKRKAMPRRAPADRYTPRSYSYAVLRACDRAKLSRWHPNQLRHTHGTKVRKTFTLEHAGAALGHTKMSTTEIYAERDMGLALEVAAKIG